MKTRITQSQLARKLGLSRSTVAAALNPSSTIKLTAETRERVALAAQEWNYRPDRYARIMRGGRSGLIGLLNFGGLLQVAAERAYYAGAALRHENFEILSADLAWNPGSTEQTCLSMLDARVEGIVVAGLNDLDASKALRQFQAARIPMVVLSGNPVEGAPHFRGDAAQATREMTRHLLTLGHRRIALLVYASSFADRRSAYTWAASERIEGFRRALKEAQGRIVPTLKSDSAHLTGIIRASAMPDDPFDPFAAGRNGMREILAARVHPSAIICGNDEMAYGAMQACREQNVAVPSGMAITGYDDIALGRACEIPLTTVRQPNQAMAEAAVKTLLESVRHPNRAKAARDRLFRCELIIRASCGAAGKTTPARTKSKTSS